MTSANGRPLGHPSPLPNPFKRESTPQDGKRSSSSAHGPKRTISNPLESSGIEVAGLEHMMSCMDL